MIIPSKLQKGDEIRILSPSSSLARVGGMAENLISKQRLEALGYQVTFSENIKENDDFFSASIEKRVADLHAAFADSKVKAILSTIGGFNSNELLPYLDWGLIQKNPKIFCGFSDITALGNAILAKTGLVTYSGPAYSSFKMDELQDYQTAMWQQAMTKSQYQLTSSSHFSDDLWFDKSLPRNLTENKWRVYNEGEATGTIVGANLSTFGLLQGTEYFPQIKDPILVVESAEEDDYFEFSRDLASILQVIKTPKAVMIGRFPKVTGMTEDLLLKILAKHPILKEVPVMYNLNFGHTQPIMTFPLGGKAKVETKSRTITILEG